MACQLLLLLLACLSEYAPGGEADMVIGASFSRSGDSIVLRLIETRVFWACVFLALELPHNKHKAAVVSVRMEGSLGLSTVLLRTFL